MINSMRKINTLMLSISISTEGSSLSQTCFAGILKFRNYAIVLGRNNQGYRKSISKCIPQTSIPKHV